VANAEVNMQKWANAIEPIYRKATEMVAKAKYAEVTFASDPIRLTVMVSSLFLIIAPT